MNFIDSFMVKWKQFTEKTRPFMNKTRQICATVAGKISFVWKYIMKFKKLFLCVPVAVFALILALRNLFSLPALVGIILAANGEFSYEMLREIAVVLPLLITGLCLLFVFMSKRILTPWLISVFSLLVPIWILFINTFPS